MKNLSIGLALAFISFQATSQTTYYSNQNGMPVGQAQQVGNTTYYSNQNGMPVGQAQSPAIQTQPSVPLSPRAPISPPNMFNNQ